MPVSLLDSATWAVPRFAPFIRMAVAHAVRRGLAEAVLRHWRRVADPADVLAGQGAPPDPGVPPLPPLPIAAIPLPDGMAAPLAAFGWSSAGWAVWLSWFRVCADGCCMRVASGCVCKCVCVERA